MKKFAMLLAFLLTVVFAGTGYADPPAHANKGRGAGKEKGAAQHKPSKQHAPRSGNRKTDDGDLIRATITALTAREIATHGGWTGYQPLPPGIAKNLARGKSLPPGIAKKTLPPGMLHRLPSYPGYEWYSVGRDLVLVSLAGMVIADILHDVFD